MSAAEPATRCTYCGREFSNHPTARQTVDHVEPMSRGGEDTPANCVPACAGCNASKSNLLPLEWMWVRAGLLQGGRGRPLTANSDAAMGPIKLQVRLPRALHAALISAAREDTRPLNSAIVLLLGRALDVLAARAAKRARRAD